MPNPTRTLKSPRGLTARQKSLVKRIKRQGLTPKVYNRAGSPSRVSVHNPFLDIVRKSKKPVRERYPHASDTKSQRKLAKLKAMKLSKKKDRIGKGLKKVFVP